jgi:hypothetical protein
MPHNDTLFVADSNSCRIIPFEHYPVRTDSITPVSALWRSSTLVNSTPSAGKPESAIETNIVSGIIFVYFITIIFFLRQIISVFNPLFKTYIRYINNAKLEEKTGLSYRRNVLGWLSVFFMAIVLLAAGGGDLKNLYGLYLPYIFLIVPGAIFSLWLVRRLIFRFTAWLTHEKNAFSVIEKISYNYFILGTGVSFFLLVCKLIFRDITVSEMFYSLIYIFSFSYILYIFRTFQVIRGHHFSIVFYILYLCAVEILPLSILTNIILLL